MQAPQGCTVEQRVPKNLIGEVEPVLNEAHAQHALKPQRATAIVGLEVVWLDDRAQLPPSTIACMIATKVSRRSGLIACHG